MVIKVELTPGRNSRLILQASSHSSYKLSPLPKLNTLDGDDIRRNSPANTPVGHNQSSLSIKQEMLDAHANLQTDLMPVSIRVFVYFVDIVDVVVFVRRVFSFDRSAMFAFVVFHHLLFPFVPLIY